MHSDKNLVQIDHSDKKKYYPELQQSLPLFFMDVTLYPMQPDQLHQYANQQREQHQ